jgi:hypothetical protein
LSGAYFWQFGASIENFQVAMIYEEAMALFAGRLTNHAELHHVLQSLRHSGRGEGELLGRRRDRDDRFALKVLVNAQNGCSRAAKLLDLPAIFFDECEYLPSMYRLPAERFLSRLLENSRAKSPNLRGCGHGQAVHSISAYSS